MKLSTPNNPPKKIGKEDLSSTKKFVVPKLKGSGQPRQANVSDSKAAKDQITKGDLPNTPNNRQPLGENSTNISTSKLNCEAPPFTPEGFNPQNVNEIHSNGPNMSQSPQKREGKVERKVKQIESKTAEADSPGLKKTEKNEKPVRIVRIVPSPNQNRVQEQASKEEGNAVAATEDCESKGDEQLSCSQSLGRTRRKTMNLQRNQIYATASPKKLQKQQKPAERVEPSVVELAGVTAPSTSVEGALNAVAQVETPSSSPLPKKVTAAKPPSQTQPSGPTRRSKTAVVAAGVTTNPTSTTAATAVVGTDVTTPSEVATSPPHVAVAIQSPPADPPVVHGANGEARKELQGGDGGGSGEDTVAYASSHVAVKKSKAAEKRAAKAKQSAVQVTTSEKKEAVVKQTPRWADAQEEEQERHKEEEGEEALTEGMTADISFNPAWLAQQTGPVAGKATQRVKSAGTNRRRRSLPAKSSVARPTSGEMSAASPVASSQRELDEACKMLDAIAGLDGEESPSHDQPLLDKLRESWQGKSYYERIKCMEPPTPQASGSTAQPPAAPVGPAATKTLPKGSASNKKAVANGNTAPGGRGGKSEPTNGNCKVKDGSVPAGGGGGGGGPHTSNNSSSSSSSPGVMALELEALRSELSQRDTELRTKEEECRKLRGQLQEAQESAGMNKAGEISENSKSAVDDIKRQMREAQAHHQANLRGLQAKLDSTTAELAEERTKNEALSSLNASLKIGGKDAIESLAIKLSNLVNEECKRAAAAL